MALLNLSCHLEFELARFDGSMFPTGKANLSCTE
jgi:hypothetical protein